MSEINVNRKIFLEQEELKRMFQFLKDTPERRVTLGNTTSYGIIKTDFITNADFLVESGTNSGTVKIERDSYALDKHERTITLLSVDNFVIPNDSVWYWMRISFRYRKHELGTVSIDINGNISGVGTKFLEVLRGQVTNVPTKVKFLKSDLTPANNSSDYEIVSVANDTTAILAGNVGFSAESNLYLVVIGATPIDEAITASQREGLYNYDDCLLELVPEVSENVAPVSGFVENETFYIARVQNTGTELTIQDKRTDFWNFNVVGIADKLDKNANLSDLTNKSTARFNLEVYSKTETDSKYLSAENNLGDVTSPTTARGNIGALGVSELAPILNNYLAKASNLNDVPDKPTARTNLGIPAAIRSEIKQILVGYITIAADGTIGTQMGLLAESPSPMTVTKLGTGNYRVTHDALLDHGINLYSVSINSIDSGLIGIGGVVRGNNSFDFWTSNDASADDCPTEICIYDISPIIP